MNFHDEINNLVDEIVRARKNKGFNTLTYKTKPSVYDVGDDVIVLTENDYNKIINSLRVFFTNICKEEEINLEMPKEIIKLIANAQDNKRVINNIVYNDNATQLIEAMDAFEEALDEEEAQSQATEETETTEKTEDELMPQADDNLNTTVNPSTPKPNATNNANATNNKSVDIKPTENTPKDTNDDKFVCKIITKNGDEPAKEYNLTKDEYAEWLKKHQNKHDRLFHEFDDIFSDDVFDIFHRRHKNNRFWF